MSAIRRWHLLVAAAFQCIGAGVAAAQFTPTLVDNSGDELYKVWRRGLITRHISANGRLLQLTALESIDDATGGPPANPALWELITSSGEVNIQHPGGVTVRIPFANARFSAEESIYPAEPEAPKRSAGPVAARLWVPLIAPFKNPGPSNEGVFAVAGGGDNALYYGGMAMATLALERKFDVGTYSLEYAHRLLKFFLESEIPIGSGMLVRRRNLLGSRNNQDGGPIIRGASTEEILGTMIGLMYLIKAEPEGPWKTAAIELRDRVLAAVARDWGTLVHPMADYAHPFIPDIEEWRYWVKSFEWPMNRAFGRSRGRKNLYEAAVMSPLTLQLSPGEIAAVLGTAFAAPESAPLFVSAGIARELVETKYFNYLLIMTSSLLMLDGDASTADKREFAEKYIKAFIRPCLLDAEEDDRNALRSNAFLGVTGLFAVRALGADNLLDPPQNIRDLFGDSYPLWQQLVQKTIAAYGSATSLPAQPWSWQANLPLLRPKNPPDGFLDHNPQGRAGDWFMFVHKKPYSWRNEWWKDAMPGVVKYGETWPPDPQALTEPAFFSSPFKTYMSTGKDDSRIGYAPTALAGSTADGGRDHRDAQVEGAGLDLLFPRMLLAQLGLVTAPQFKEESPLPSLPFIGASPIFPGTIRSVAKYRSDGEGVNNFRVYGDKPDELRVVNLPRHAGRFVTLSKNSRGRQRLAMWRVTTPSITGGRQIELLWDHFGDEFAKAQLLVTDFDGDEVVVVVAQGVEGTTPFRKRFLHIETWRVGNASLTPISSYSSNVRASGAAKEIDAWVTTMPDIVGGEDQQSTVLTVMTRSDNNNNLLHVFHLERLSDFGIREVTNGGQDVDGGIQRMFKSHLAGTGRAPGIIAYTQSRQLMTNAGVPLANQFRVETRKVYEDGVPLSGRIATSSWVAGSVLDLRIIDTQWALEVVALVEHNGLLEYHTWYLGRQNAQLVEAGRFSASQSGDALAGREVLIISPQGNSPYHVQDAHAEIVELPAFFDSFVTLVKGAGFSARDNQGHWKDGAPGVRVLRGRLATNGLAGTESWGVTGGGERQGAKQLALSGAVCDNPLPSSEGCGVISINAGDDRYLNIVYWSIDDPFRKHRWVPTVQQLNAIPKP